ncbi:hypothetical protein CGMCC3_g7183 [Colletotrichum fructicola]|nr:uncharacterized protein CGMCC3_g7183 [Colletotrichum fructicola]KAE9576872.1 hypothetical protein CGMCC3_g7183 [Colletotrichum fructicola]KAF4413171.1 hypothetical protein CFRS1_v004240 [Colletotrichum fructicola]
MAAPKHSAPFVHPQFHCTAPAARLLIDSDTGPALIAHLSVARVPAQPTQLYPTSSVQPSASRKLHRRDLFKLVAKYFLELGPIANGLALDSDRDIPYLRAAFTSLERAACSAYL